MKSIIATAARRLVLLLCITNALNVAAQSHNLTDVTDRILKFHSDIKVLSTGRIEVTETITIYNGDGNASLTADQIPSSNDDIKRGIVRDFPTRYLDSVGLWHTTGFDVKSVTRNGVEEPYHTESLSNGRRILVGSEDVYLTPGVYTYVINYTTSRQLIFHDNKDELYWNVNGNGWVFTADSISATVEFPSSADILEWDCYTGPQGATAKDCSERKLAANKMHFTGNRRFEPFEGLTIAVAINKGILIPPSSLSKYAQLTLDNFIVPLLLLLTIALFAFYYISWKRKGRDPRKGTIIPQFEPPSGLAPADTGYIVEQEFGSHLFAASLVDAAVHQQLEIEVEKKGAIFKNNAYNFNQPSLFAHRAFSSKNEPASDSGVHENGNKNYNHAQRYGFPLSSIYGQSAEKGKYNSKLKELQTSLETNLRKKFQVSRKNKSGQGYFTLNSRYIWIGNAVLIASAAGSFLFIANYFSEQLLIAVAILLVVMLTIHMVFARIMSAYTKEGRAIADQILGFKMYLETAEQKVFDQLAVPEKTLDLFEKYLPYAIALGVENEWAEKFDQQIKEAMEQGYQPTYFHRGSGFSNGFSFNELSSGLSSGLSNTISSASTPPSSSSGGSGGGGRSGGGGGGGGGGGW